MLHGGMGETCFGGLLRQDTNTFRMVIVTQDTYTSLFINLAMPKKLHTQFSICVYCINNFSCSLRLKKRTYFVNCSVCFNLNLKIKIKQVIFINQIFYLS